MSDSKHLMVMPRPTYPYYRGSPKPAGPDQLGTTVAVNFTKSSMYSNVSGTTILLNLSSWRYHIIISKILLSQCKTYTQYIKEGNDCSQSAPSMFLFVKYKVLKCVFIPLLFSKEQYVQERKESLELFLYFLTKLKDCTEEKIASLVIYAMKYIERALKPTRGDMYEVRSILQYIYEIALHILYIEWV